MQDATAIDAIERLALGKHDALRRQLEFTDLVAVPHGYTLQSLESQNEARNRWRGRFQTGDLESFARAVAEQPHAVVYVDRDKLAARAIFNVRLADNQPGHADHVAVLTLRRTPEYLAVQSLHGQVVTQAQLIEWLDDWQHIVAAYSTAEGESIAQGAALAAIRDISVDATTARRAVERDMEIQHGLLEKIAVRDEMLFPSRIGLSFLPAEHLTHAYARVRASVIPKDGKPSIRLRVPGLSRLEEEIAQDFARALAERITAPIFIGSYDAGA